MKKHSINLLLLMCLSFLANAQSVFTNTTSESLSIVISDYSNGFKNIRGNVIYSESGRAEYHSKVIIENAMQCYIHSYEDNHYPSTRWECLINETSDFKMAAQKFRALYEQISKAIVKPHGEKPYILVGNYLHPQEAETSTVIAFQLLPAIGALKDLNITLRLEDTGDVWKIFLVVHD